MAGARRKRGASSSSERVWADIEAKEESPEPRDDGGRLSVLVEMVSMPGASAMVASAALREETVGGLELDEEFQPIPLGGGSLEAAVGLGVAGTPTYVVRARVDDEAAMAELRKRPDVVEVWRDSPIAPFQTCPIPPVRLQPRDAEGHDGRRRQLPRRLPGLGRRVPRHRARRRRRRRRHHRPGPAGQGRRDPDGASRA